MSSIDTPFENRTTGENPSKHNKNNLFKKHKPYKMVLINTRLFIENLFFPIPSQLNWSIKSSVNSFGKLFRSVPGFDFKNPIFDFEFQIFESNHSGKFECISLVFYSIHWFCFTKQKKQITIAYNLFCSDTFSKYNPAYILEYNNEWCAKKNMM